MAKADGFSNLNFDYLSQEQQIQHSQRFLQTMRKRRTVRDFSSEPIPFELIKNAIATAATAPSGANQQPWTFVVVSNPDLKKKIRVAAEAEEKESYERRMSQEWLDALAPLGTDWHKPHLEEAPYLIVIFRQSYGLVTDPLTGEASRVKHYYSDESVGIALGMLLCSLHLAGLATLTHTPSPMQFLADILERPQNERAFMLIATGLPAEDAQVPNITKKPLEQLMILKD
ncbi:nitroreductase family protein [Anaerolineales bacterium]